MITHHIRIVRSSLRIAANSLRYLRIVTYHFRMVYGKNQSMGDRKNIFFWHVKTFFSASTDRYGCLRSVTSYIRISESYFRMLATDYDLEIVVRNRKKNPCMWTRYKDDTVMLDIFIRSSNVQLVGIYDMPLSCIIAHTRVTDFSWISYALIHTILRMQMQFWTHTHNAKIVLVTSIILINFPGYIGLRKQHHIIC